MGNIPVAILTIYEFDVIDVNPDTVVFLAATPCKKEQLVDDDGEADFLIIQDAIDFANDGDTIFVYNGSYYENLTINKSIKLIGGDKNTTIIDGKNKSEMITIVTIISSGTLVQGFTIRNTLNI